MSQQPTTKPNNPCFSSGPCAKRPGWSLAALDAYALPGRSHRAGPAKKLLKSVIDLHTELLGIPDDYYVGIVPASDTGAVEMALWSMIGPRGVDVFAWESFSKDWMKDVVDHLGMDDVRTFVADYGDIADLSQADAERDIVFAWNGTTSGVRVPDGEWIAADRSGLTICDATSAVFAYDMPWDKLDVTTWSWQKVLGSEAAHGMIVLSPRAVARLESFVPDNRPLPKIFRMTKKGKLNEGVFEGLTINTPSMLAVADVLDALNWVKSIGGAEATRARTKANYDAFAAWVRESDWVDFLAADADVRSLTSVCLKVKDAWFMELPEDDRLPFVKAMLKPLDEMGVAYDIASYRDAPAGIRVWCGATVETSDVEALLPWLDWAYAQAKTEAQGKAAA
jgi:phosphoserine aminotransferase